MSRLNKILLVVIVCLCAGLALAWGLQTYGRVQSTPAQAEQDKINRMSVAELIATGDQLYTAKKYSRALTYYEKASQKVPSDAGIWLRMGALYQLKNRLADAEQELLAAYQLAPQNAEVTFRLATIYRDSHRYKSAVDFATKTLTLITPGGPEEARILLVNGEAQIWLGDFDGAKKSYERVMAIKPDEITAYQFDAILIWEQNQTKALQQLQHVIDVAADTPLAAKAKAAQTRIQNLKTVSNNNDREIAIATLYLEQGLPSMTVDRLSNLVKNNNSYQAGHYYLAYCYLLLSDLTRAKQEIEVSLKMSSPSPLAYYFDGEIHTALGEWADAILSYSTAIDLGDKQFETYQHLAYASAQNQAFDNADKAYAKAIETHPDNLEVRVSEVNILINNLKSTARAVTAAKAAADKFPTVAKAQNLYGWALMADGQFDAAEQLINKALLLDPNLAAAHLNLGDVYRHKGLASRAQDEYQQALDLDFDGGIAPIADGDLRQMVTSTKR